MKIRKIVVVLAAVIVIALAYLLPFRFYPLYREKLLRDELDRRSVALLATLSLEQKVGQLFHVGMPGETLNRKIRTEIERRHVGGVILFGHNLKNRQQIGKLTASLQRLAGENGGIPLFISTDQEGGRVFRFPADSATQFPGAMALGQTGRPDLVRDVGFITAIELEQAGINLILAPVLDVNNNPENPVINTRAFGSDVETVTRMGTALARGIREAGSTPVIKHFPGHGDTETDSHLALPSISRSLARIETLELLPFRRAIEEGAPVVMSAHILYGALDPKYPATLSPSILTGLLRGKLGFKGVIMTDAMEMNAIAKNYQGARSARLAFRAGADIILLTDSGKECGDMYNSLLRGFRSHELSTARLDRAVLRQLRLKLERGLFFRHRPAEYEGNILTEALRERKATIEREYHRLLHRYEQGPGLNALVSHLGIVSLRREFGGLAPARRKSVRLFYRTAVLRKRAGEAGLSDKSLLSGGMRRFLQEWRRREREIRHSGRKAGGDVVGSPAKNALIGKDSGTWLVELTPADLRNWNAWQRMNRGERTGDQQSGGDGFLAIALYSGNPFLPLAVSSRGVVLCSFSPTVESVRALLVRALDGKPVHRANLILPDDKKVFAVTY